MLSNIAFTFIPWHEDFEFRHEMWFERVSQNPPIYEMMNVSRSQQWLIITNCEIQASFPLLYGKERGYPGLS